MTRERTAGHTPGPWTVGHEHMDVGCENAKIGGYAKLFDIRGWGYLTGKGHGALGLSWDEAYEIQRANAALIAAAPTMLAALKECLGLAEIAETLTGCRSDDDYVQGIRETIEAAISRAESTALSGQT